MKSKTYLLIVDFLLIVNRILLSIKHFVFAIKLSVIVFQRRENALLKTVKFSVFKLIFVLFTCLIGFTTYSQTYKAFSIREKIDIRGKMIVAGNTILGKDNLPFNDDTKSNQDISMQYIDIDGDASTFSSSSADLSVPPQKDGSATTCYRVAYAALYWGAMLQNGSRTNINKVKLKLPGSTTYNDITGEVVYDAIVSPIIPDANKPYACYADVTNLLSGLTNLTGTYTVANVTSSIGANGSTGLSAGWTLFVVYEDPSLHMKSFNVFDGFSHVYSSHFEKIPVTGFITPPSGNIDLQFAYAALDGDKPQGGTKLEFGTKQVVTPLRPANRFFNSTIENTNGVSTPRNPTGSNTLGYDTGVLEVIGADPEYIVNNQTSTDFTLQVAKGQADPVFVFFSAYAVDIIAPKIDLTKIVKNTSGVDVGGGNVNLGQSLTYEISYQSVGNDNVTNFIIKDVLPINITFNPATNIDYTNAGGATLQSYDPLTRTIIFNIPNSSVEVNDGIYTIRLNIQVVPDCNSLITACSNVIKNQAFATYQGVINSNIFQEEGSFASTACKLGSPESTNFLVDISNCKFTQNVILCGASVVLRASDGYTDYKWSRDPNSATPTIGTGQTFTATQTGVFYVHNTAPSTCKDIVEEITVKNFGVTNTNPVIPYAQSPYVGEVVICPDDGKQLPNLFLCGANDSRLIQTGISDATSIEWYKLNEGSCVAVVNPDCANESPSCSWALVGNGPDFTANISGQFRLTIRYPGGCFSQFYFNVYQNLLNPTATSKDILCNTNGQITVGGVPSGYEYSLNASGPFQPSNVFPNASFPIINAGSYTVYIKQVGVTASPCIFSVPNILIRQRNFTVSTILTQPLCNGDKGSIKLIANDALPQYYFSISQGATLVNSVGPIIANEYQFSNLNPGTYTVRVRTDDGCDYSNNVTIIEPALLTATAAITKPLTCTDGEIAVYPVGGTPPYIYYVNNATVFQNSPQIAIANPLSAGGVYNILIEDSNNCTTTASITVAAIPPPVYTMNQVNIKCYNEANGVISLNVTNANGYSLAYSIDNGGTYLPTPTFFNLAAGTYNTIVRYTLGKDVCYGTMQPITITQPAAAITAAAAVSELAGCGPLGEGKIRITNPQGGTAPYEYSFDNQVIWTTLNEAYKPPGNYTVYIRDANGCIFTMPNIIINQPPIAPAINVSTPVFNCDGSSRSAVTVTTTPNVDYSYQYLLDGVVNTNTPSNVFVNILAGTHIISVKYISTSTAISCIPQSDFPFIVPTGNAFNASITGFKSVSCTGANDGIITIAAQNFDPAKGFQYSTNNGAIWITQLTSPHTITGLASGTYAIQIRYDATSTGTCLKTFSQTIMTPTPLTVAASVTTLATCSSGATITAIGSGGTLAYQYELRDAVGVVVIRPYQLNAQFTNVVVGNYTVFVKDANGCMSNIGAPINIVSPPTLTATLHSSSDLCFDSLNQASLIVNVSGGKAPFIYSLDGNAAQNSATFNNVGTGNHTIVVTDSNNCTATISNIVIAPQLNVVASTTKTLDCTASPNAIITGVIAGGTAPFVVTLLSGTGPGTIAQPTTTTYTYSTAVANTYQFQIQDAKGCITTAAATVNTLNPITATTTAVNPTCNGASNGSVQIIPSGGIGSYTYSFNGSSFTNVSFYSNLNAGISYAYQVRDSNNCSFAGTLILTQPSTLVTSATTTAFSCNATNIKQSAVVTIAVPTTGTSPYQYSFNGSGFTNNNSLTLNDTGIDQLISYSVKDANGCIYSNTITVLKLNPVTDLSFSAAAITCSTTNTTVTVTPTNGVGTLTYAITFPLASVSSNTTGVFAGLTPGTYVFKVTDANGCFYSESFVVNPVTPIAVIATKLSDVGCFGNSTGSIRYTVSGFSGTYSYSINGGVTITGQSATILTLPNLAANTYTVVFTDEITNCTFSTTVTITQPIAALSATTAQINANCFSSTSQVTVSPLGGTSPYTFAYKQDGQVPIASDYISNSSANLNPTTNANWDIWAKDANGCTLKLDVTLTIDSTPTITASATGQCLGAGSYIITATGSGGVGTLTYSINNGGSYQVGNTFVVTTASSYIIRVKDANGCTADSAPVVVAPQLTLTAVLNKDITCNPSPTAAQITLTAIGGKGVYTYTSFPSTGTFTGNVYTTTTPGNYIFTVTDSNVCSVSTSSAIVVSTPINPDITGVSQTQFINCNGEATAAISIAIDNTKGQAPFVFNVLNTTTSINYGTQTSGLRAGNYNITITDAKGCTDTFPFVISEPLPMVYTFTKNEIICSGSGTTLGSIIATPTGGTAPYTYYITNNVGATVNPPSIVGGVYTFDIVNFGVYELSFIDARGCSYKQVITMASPPNDLTINVNVGAPSCTTSSIDVTVNPAVLGGPYHFALFPIISGSTPPYDYVTNMSSYQNANDSNVLNPGYLQSTFTGLNPGVIYSFIVYDEATNCYYFKQAESPTLTASTLTSTVSPNNVKCKGAADGSVDFTFTNTYPVTTDVTYQIFNSQTNLPTSIPVGTVFGLNGTVTTPINDLGLLGTGTYYILFEEISLGANNGCTNASLIFTISESPFDLSITANLIQNANCSQDGIIGVQAQGGTAPYTYQVITSATDPLITDTNWVSGNTFTRPGSVLGTLYYVYSKDAFGCIKQDTEIVFQDENPTITAPITPICYDGSTPFTTTILGTVDPDIVGAATYSINGSAFQNSPNFTFNAAGTYNLVIKDGNGCIANANYEVYPKLNITATLTKELDCTSSPAATISLNTIGGDTTPTPNYTYEVSFNGGTFVIASNPYAATTAGDYVFRVTDANNPTVCQASTTFILDPIPQTVFTTTQSNVSCFGGNDGVITVNVTSGVGSYEYQLNAGVFQTSNQFTGLAAGITYVVTVRNAKNCTLASAAIAITEPLALAATSLITTPLTCGPGNAAQPATVTVNGLDGTAPYLYSFDGGSNYSTTNTYQSYVGITFDVLLKDAKGCLYTLVNGVNIPALVPPTNLDFVSTAVTCLALTSNITLTTTNGVGALSYVIVSPASATSNVTGASSGIFTGLSPDTYLFQVTDANFCTYQESYTVNLVTNITVSGQLINNVTCNPGSNGEVLFRVSNFAGTYTYSINGGAASSPQSNPTISVSGLNAASTQTIIVTDLITGCTATTFINVTQPAPLALVANPFINGNCNFGAQVSVTASGGVAPYIYSYVISGAPAGTYSTSASAVLNPAIATSWDVYVRDVNGCLITTPLTITIATDPLPSGITVSGLNQCPSATGTYSFTVNVAAGIAPFEYSIGNGFQTSPNFTVNVPGTYNFMVKDANGCLTTVPGLVGILPALQLQSNITALPSCIDSDGTLTLLATGGSGNYEYSIDSGGFQPSANFTNIFAGIHTLTVRDISTTCTQSISVNLLAATQITGFVLAKTDVTCSGGNDGTITATMSNPSTGINDNPIYTYSIDGGVTTQTSAVFSELIAGTYTVEVTSGRGCLETQTTVVNEPNVITFPMPTVVQFGCNSVSNAMNFATITVTAVTGGSGVYTNYEFIKGGTRVQFGASNTYTEANLLGGTYTVNVYDDNGCMNAVPSTVTIAPFIALDKINVAVTNAINCTNLEGITVLVSSIGGTPSNLQYSLVDVSGVLLFAQNSTGIFTGLNIGNYIIKVENLDTGCSVQSVHYVNNPNTFDLNINNIVDVTCLGAVNGSANITIVDRTITATNPDQAGPFSYTIVDAFGNPVNAGITTNAGPFTINSLAAGNYSITATLTNSPYCSVTKNFTINQPTAALTLTETHTEITCISGNNDGSIAASVVGGWPGGYQFQLELGATVVTPWSAVANFTGLTQGTYTVRVRDSRGCSVFVNVILANPTPIVFAVTPSTTLLNCFRDKNASITVSLPTGGQGSNYLYTLNTATMVPAAISGPQVSPIFNGLGAGTYTITVTDGYNCSATSVPIVIAEPAIVVASLVVASTQTCNNQTTLTLSAFGGTPPYSYSADGVTYNAITFNSSVTFPKAVGTYHYFVKDTNGCASYVSNDIQIDPLPALVIKLDLSNAVVNCAGDATGVIVATADGGLSNYVYTLQDGAGNPLPATVQSSPGVFTQLVAGGYRVQVSSLDCSATSALITVTEPSTPLVSNYLATDATCNGNNNGTITINASGGTGIIKYAISPRLDQFFVSNAFKLLQPGSYDIIAQDQKGCFIYTTAIVIAEPTIIIPRVDPASIMPEICFGDNDGFFSIDIIGGTAPYSVSLDKINGPFTFGTVTQTQFDFNGLSEGDHTVYVRDANLCNAEISVLLASSVKLYPNAKVDYGCLNNTLSTSVTVSVDSSITNPADVDYALDGSGVFQASNIFTNLPAGIHFVTARHTNGCEKKTPDFEILPIQPLTLELKNGGLNEIVATTTGGRPEFRYTLNGEDYGSKNTFIYYKSGEYTVTVTDSNGCVASAIKYFEFIDIDIPNVFTPNGDGNNDGWLPTNTINYPDLIFHVFDRYGRIVGTFKEGQSWDGKYNDKELPTGDYWYVLKLRNEEDSREFVGHFTLYR